MAITAQMLNTRNPGANPELVAAQRGIDERTAYANGERSIATAPPGGSETQALVSRLMEIIPREATQNPTAVLSAVDTFLSFIVQLGQMAGEAGGVAPQSPPGGQMGPAPAPPMPTGQPIG